MIFNGLEQLLVESQICISNSPSSRDQHCCLLEHCSLQQQKLDQSPKAWLAPELS